MSQSMWIFTSAVVVYSLAFAGLVLHLGRKYGSSVDRLERVSKALEEKAEHIGMIPVVKGHVETLLGAFLEERRRLNNVLPNMQMKVRALWGHVFPNRDDDEGPHMNGNGNGHGG